ncbi:permease prefix domain 1-containing protein [Priestia flexa]
MGLEKKFDMYIKDLCKKVKNKDVHDSIKLEISDHLHTLKEEAMLAGLSEEEAIDRALAYMGDVEVLGKQLNEIHKAQIDFKTAIPVIAVSFLGYWLCIIYNSILFLLRFKV